MQKKGQLTIFIVIGIVFIISLFLIISTRDKIIQNKFESVNPRLGDISDSLKIFVESCMMEIAQQNLDHGYIELPYYIETQLPSCIHNFQSDPYDISSGSLDAQIIKAKDNSSLNLIISYPITIRSEDSEVTIDDYNIKLPLKATKNIPIDDNGVLTQDFELKSHDKKLTLNIKSGSEIKDSSGQPIRNLSINMVDATNDNISKSLVGGVYYDIQPHANISGNATIRWNYDEKDLALFSDENLVFARVFNDIPIVIPSVTDNQDNILTANISQTNSFILLQGSNITNIKYDMYYTLDNSLKQEALSKNYTIQESLGYAFDSYVENTLPLFELYNRQTAIHLYTTSKNQMQWLIDNSQYKDNGIVGFIEATQKPGNVPIYKLRPVFGGDVILTTNTSLKNDAVNNLKSIMMDSYTTNSGDINDFADEAVAVIDGGNYSRDWNLSPTGANINFIDYRDYVYAGKIGYIYQYNKPGTKEMLRLMNVKATVFWGPFIGIIRQASVLNNDDNDLGMQPIVYSDNMITAGAITDITGYSIASGLEGVTGLASGTFNWGPSGTGTVATMGLEAALADHGVSISGILGLSPSISAAISAMSGPASTALGIVGSILGGPIGSVIGHIVGMAIDAHAAAVSAAEAAALSDQGINIGTLGDVTDTGGISIGGLGDISDNEGIDIGGLGDVGDNGGVGFGMDGTGDPGFGDEGDGETGANMGGNAGADSGDSGGVAGMGLGAGDGM